jgi:hypothetical protein
MVTAKEIGNGSAVFEPGRRWKLHFLKEEEIRVATL